MTFRLSIHSSTCSYYFKKPLSGISIWGEAGLCRHWHKDVYWQSCSWPLRWTIRSHCIKPLALTQIWWDFVTVPPVRCWGRSAFAVQAATIPSPLTGPKKQNDQHDPLAKGRHKSCGNVQQKQKTAQLCSPVQAVGRILDRNRLIS